MKTNILIPALILATAFTAVVVAQDAATPRDGTRAIRMVEHRLKVTDAQREQAKAILIQERPTIQQLHDTLAEERAEYAQSNTFDEARTRAIAAKYADANTAAIVEREKVRTELVAILTPEQQQKLQQMRARFGTLLNERLQTLGDTL